MNLIAAADENWGIGKEGGLLAHLPGDMKFFRETTNGKVVVMGRKTLESFPGKRPLKNRVNIALTKNPKYQPEGVIICHSVEEILEEIKKYSRDEVFLIGGGEIYKTFLPYCDRAYITHIYAEFPADTFLPNLDENLRWSLLKSGEKQEENGICYEFRTYERMEKEA